MDTKTLFATDDHVWDTRFAEGGKWGPTREDTAKKHPRVIAYRDLPESEKIHDRETAFGTLHAILALGYIIQPLPAIP